VYLVKKEGKQGLYNRRGQVLIVPKYDKLISLSGMGFMAKLGNKYGLLNSYGSVVEPCEYDYIGIDYNDDRTFICVKGSETKKVKMYKSN
jgi:WG containing repeat